MAKGDKAIDSGDDTGGILKGKGLILIAGVVILSVGLAYICVAPPTDLPNWPLYTANAMVWQTVERLSRAVKPYHVRVLETASAYLESRTMYLVAHLDVPDVLHEKQVPLSCEELKPHIDYKKTGEAVNLSFFCRLLHAAAHFDLLQEEGKGKYSLTELGKYLVSSHPKSLKNYVEMAAGDEASVVATSLTHSMFTGVSGFKETYRVELLEQLEKDPVFREIFDRGQADSSRLVAPALIADYPPFGSCKHICDLGGGVGSFLYQVLQHYGFGMKGTVFELPKVVENARVFLGEKKVQKDQMNVVSGNFLEEVPDMGCDCYILKDILNNWADDMTTRILQNVQKAMQPQSRLLIMERVLHTADYAEEKFKALMDLTMMAFNPSQSRLRTEEEIHFLLEQTSFVDARTFSTRAGYSIVEAYKSETS